MLRKTQISRLIWMSILFCLLPTLAQAQEYSKGGFYSLDNSPRQVLTINPQWRFIKQDVPGAEAVTFDDSGWQVVNLPHGLEYLPEEASGSINYQGKAWYRKRMDLDPAWEGKKLFLHFEAIMGKSKIWVNGQLVKEQFGGFLPAIADITEYVDYTKPNVIAVCADNSDDAFYAPGKPQRVLDFTYFGGIYRDSYLVVQNNVHITDANYEEEVAGGGLRVHYPRVGKDEAKIDLQLHLRNEESKSWKGQIEYRLLDKQGKEVAKATRQASLKRGQARHFDTKMAVVNPNLWTPDTPYLYDLEIKVMDEKGEMEDGVRRRLGLRTVDFDHERGLILNGEAYPEKLIGANRHQDFALLGNALPNSIHWRDAKKLRDAGMRIIRSAHYPQDPAFMDACDELGLFVIVATPGWQFWNQDPIFAQRIYHDIRQMVRRDRNHPSLFMWEPILNETHYPDDFAQTALNNVAQEMPFDGTFSACDGHAKGASVYPVIYSHPRVGSEDKESMHYIDKKKVYFTREFGDNVDDWSSHNSTSRVHKSWGEAPMLVQAQLYEKPEFKQRFTSLEAIYSMPSFHFGGTLWHSFDHQRGYHPQTFYGGVMDAFRQPKTSYYMFMSQRPNEVNEALQSETGPMIYVAHEMSPFSSEDVKVYSNCDEVRLTVFEGSKPLVYKRSSSNAKVPYPSILFEDVFDFMKLKGLSRAGKHSQVYILAEGYIDGQKVVEHKRIPSRRPTQVRLRLDDEKMGVTADGADVVAVVAEICDANGVVKRLQNYAVEFRVEGEGELINDAALSTNPMKAHYGEAIALVKSTLKPGKVRIYAKVMGEQIGGIVPAELEFETKPSENLLYNKEQKSEKNSVEKSNRADQRKIELLQRENALLRSKLDKKALEAVELQQDAFGEAVE